LMLTLLAEEKGNEVLVQYLPQLEKEYAFWMDGAENLSVEKNTYRRVVSMPDGSILNRYWDDHATPRPEAYIEDKHIAANSGREITEVYRHIRAAAESGWDFSSRWFRDEKNMETIQTTDLIPVDLNCLLIILELTLATTYGKREPGKSRDMSQKAHNRNKAIQQYCWNEEKGFYFDHNWKDRQQTNCFTLAGVYPLLVNMCGFEKAGRVAECIEKKFLKAGGVITTLNKTGQQWDAPNGWAPLQWITYKSLQIFGHTKLAHFIKQNWMQNNEKVYAATGKMMEKYNVADTQTKAGGGEYPNQDGFGWTNGVYLKFLSESR
jgi:alpha,alpha-trehalase